jgi:hypothetical protein
LGAVAGEATNDAVPEAMVHISWMGVAGVVAPAR